MCLDRWRFLVSLEEYFALSLTHIVILIFWNITTRNCSLMLILLILDHSWSFLFVIKFLLELIKELILSLLITNLRSDELLIDIILILKLNCFLGTTSCLFISSLTLCMGCGFVTNTWDLNAEVWPKIININITLFRICFWSSLALFLHWERSWGHVQLIHRVLCT